jgi:hypothetical protein
MIEFWAVIFDIFAMYWWTAGRSFWALRTRGWEERIEGIASFQAAEN